VAERGGLIGDAPGTSSDQLHVFTDAYNEYRLLVYRRACCLCGPALADDVTQEVFARLWLHPEEFDPTRGSLRTFLLMRCYGSAIDAVRSQGRRRSSQERSHRLDRSPDALAVDAGLLHDELAEVLAGGIETLPFHEREAIRMAFYGRCTYQQAAALLGQPEGTVKSRIRTGLRRLHAVLAENQTAAAAS